MYQALSTFSLTDSASVFPLARYHSIIELISNSTGAFSLFFPCQKLYIYIYIYIYILMINNLIFYFYIKTFLTLPCK